MTDTGRQQTTESGADPRARALFTAAGLAVLTLDRGGAVRQWNAAAERLLGWAAGEVLGQALPALLDTERDAFLAELEAACKARPPACLSGLWRRRDGALLDVLVWPAPVPGPDAEVVCAVADVTPLKRAERDLADLACLEDALRESEGRFRGTFENAAVGIAHIDRSGRWLRVNQKLCDTLGYPREELLHRTSQELTHPDDRAADLERFDRLMRGEVATDAAEKRYLHRDGHVVWVRRTTSAQRDAAGKPLFCISVVEDISARKKAEAALAESLALLDSLLANAPIGFAFFDREYRYVRINDYLAAINGVPAAAHLGRPIREVLPANADPVELVLEQVFRTGEAVTDLEIAGETPAQPGVRRHWLTGFYPVRTPDGQTPWVGAIVTEITERKRLEAELRRRAEGLSLADRRKDEFLAMLAHELRNPLAPMRNALHLLRQNGDPAVAAGARDLLERQLRNLTRLVDDLLDVSRVTRGRITLKKEPVPLASAVRRAAEACRTVMDQRGHTLIVQAPEDGTVVDADPTRLEQVLTNLLNNAAKFTDPGGRVEISAGREGDSAVVRVRDNGVGMAPEMAERAFDLFAQADRSLERSQGGLGIGLTLVKRLVEMHGGSVEAHSAGPGLGSVFTVRLPARAGSAVPPPERGPPPTAAPARHLLRILVVDDSRDAADSLALLLRAAGHTVRAVYDSWDALAEADAFVPQALLLDIGLPTLDGYELARQLRARPATAAALFVAVSGYGTEDDRARSLAAGFDHHLTKPVEPDDLLALLANRAADVPRPPEPHRGDPA